MIIIAVWGDRSAAHANVESIVTVIIWGYSPGANLQVNFSGVPLMGTQKSPLPIHITRML
jgi:hypothetical protein